MTPAPRLVEVTRRDEATGRELVESTHVGHVVVTVDDEVVFAHGDAERPTFLRSSVKPVQALVCLDILDEAGWPDGRPELAEVAVGWASHRAQDEHLDAVAQLCARAELDPDALTCPADRRPDFAAHEQRRLFHNCSGKHALFALAGRPIGLSGAQLLDPTRALQTRAVAQLDRELGGVDAAGVDGCGAPAVRAPLVGLARLFSRIACDERWALIREAGRAHPDLVAGAGMLESSLLGQGIAAKHGAEGIYGAGWQHDGRRLGVAIKVEDGALRAAATVLAAVVQAAGRSVGDWTGEMPRGGGGVVGHVRVPEMLTGALADVLG